MTLDQLRPPVTEGLPAVEWGSDPATPAQLYQRYDEQVAGATVAALQFLSEAEPAVTGDVRGSVPDGCRMHGLAFRMKSPGSLAAKINRKAEADPDASPYDVSEKITDLLRYTAVADSPAGVVSMARESVRRLRRRGWDMVEAEHTYVPGNPYKGLHTVLRHRQTGQEVEVQFHSEDSIRIKEAWHPSYEVMRDDDQPLAERAAAYRAMAQAWEDVRAPAGLDDLRVLGGVSVVAKTYVNHYDKKTKGRRP